MTLPLPYPYLPGAEVSNSLAEAAQGNFDDISRSWTDAGLVVVGGAFTVTTPASQAVGAGFVGPTVPHSLGRLPGGVIVSSQYVPPVVQIAGTSWNWSSSGFDTAFAVISGNTGSGQVATFAWLAFAVRV